MKAMVLGLMFVAVAAFENCASRATAPASQNAKNPMVGQLVHVSGTAEDARISGVVISNDFMVYCLNVQEWPRKFHKRTVTVTGKLEYTEEFMGGKNAAGEYTAGTTSGVYVIRNCQIDSQ